MRSGLEFKTKLGGSASNRWGCITIAEASGVHGSEIVNDLLVLVAARSESVEDPLLVRLLREGLSRLSEVVDLLLVRLLRAGLSGTAETTCKVCESE